MATTVSKANSELPSDLVPNILSRLPVKSLLRFKSLSKSCYNLIKSPSFVNQHLNHSKLNPNPLFNAILSTVSVPKTDKDCFRVNLIDALDKPIDLSLPFISGCNEIYQVLGLCDGLICINMDNNESDNVICNPLTADFRVIPPPELRPEFNEECTFFGFCLNSDKGYELFRIFCEIMVPGELVLFGEAYSMTTNTWRQIDVKKGDLECLYDPYEPRSPYKKLPVFMRGVFYWEATYLYLHKKKDMIVTFDVGNEVLDQISIPSNCFSHEWRIRDLNDELAIYYHTYLEFDIWVFSEKKKDWKRTFTLLLYNYVLTTVLPDDYFLEVNVLGCVASGELVLVLQECCGNTSRLCLYDTETGEVKSFSCLNTCAFSRVFLYTESLVSVNSGDGVVKSDYMIKKS